jgi:hypothetical protein
MEIKVTVGSQMISAHISVVPNETTNITTTAGTF